MKTKHRVNQLKIGSLLSYGQMALAIVIGLVYTPIMLRILGQSEYGLYNTVSTTIAMLSILNLGFNSSYIRYFSKYKKEDNQEAIEKLNGLFIILFSIIGCIALICGLFLSFNLRFVFDTGLTESEYQTARALMLLLSVNLALSFPAGVFVSIVSAHEKYVFLKLLGMAKTVLSPLVTLPLLLLGYRSIAMVAVTVTLSLVTDILYGVYVIKHLRQRFVFRDFEKGIFKSLFVYSGFIAINLIVDQINWNVDKFLLGRFLGTASVAVYSVGFTLYNYYMMFSTAISAVFTPRIHAIVNETKAERVLQRTRLTELFVKVGRIQFLILGLIASGVVFFGKNFIAYWAGEGYEESYYVALLLILPATVALIQNLGIEVQRAQNKHRFRSYVYFGMALINLVLSIFLCRAYGAVGAAVGTAFALIVANGIVMNIYYHLQCNIDVIVFWKNILRVGVGLLPPIGVGIAITYLVPITSLLSLIIWIGIYAAVYCLSVLLLGMNAYERQLLKKPIEKLLKRKHD